MLSESTLYSSLKNKKSETVVHTSNQGEKLKQ